MFGAFTWPNPVQNSFSSQFKATLFSNIGLQWKPYKMPFIHFPSICVIPLNIYFNHRFYVQRNFRIVSDRDLLFCIRRAWSHQWSMLSEARVVCGIHSLFIRWVGRVWVGVTKRNSISEVYHLLYGSWPEILRTKAFIGVPYHQE